MKQKRTLEEIQKAFDEAIKKASANPEAVIELRRDKLEAEVRWQQEHLAERERELWIREALGEFPLAAVLREKIAGDTEEAVREATKTLHEQVEQQFNKYAKDKRMRELVAAQLAAEQPNSQESSGDAGGS